MDKYNKFWVAWVAPIAAVVMPLLSDGYQAEDFGLIVVGVLTALGVYAAPNSPATAAAPRRTFD